MATANVNRTRCFIWHPPIEIGLSETRYPFIYFITIIFLNLTTSNLELNILLYNNIDQLVLDHNHLPDRLAFDKPDDPFIGQGRLLEARVIGIQRR